MALPGIGGGDARLLRTAANIEGTHQDTIKVGHIVRAGTSDCSVNSCADNECFSAVPVGRVVSIEKGSKVCTVDWFNVKGIVTQRYSTVATGRGSTIICANDKSTITGSTATAAQDNTYIWAIDTSNSTMTFLVM